MAELESVIMPCLARLQPRSICEIGVEKGCFTERLLAYCRSHQCSYTGVDVAVEPQVFPLGSGCEARFIKGRSLEILPSLVGQDVYLMDGDHNYYTVLNELRLIGSDAGRHPLVLLHDVGWPCDRRDMYYQPEAIPAEHRNPSRRGVGPVPGQPELAEWGLGCKYGDSEFSVAEVEGGPGNGVRTAVEDYLKESAGIGWQWLVVPGIFGLGILYKPASCSSAVLEFLNQLAVSVEVLGAVLGKIEENRVQMFAAFLQNFQRDEALTIQYHELQKAYDELRTHSRDLLASYRDLAAYTRKVEAENKTLRDGGRSV
jgi:hypothetical protein